MKQRILELLDKEAFFRREFGELPRPRGDEVQVICPFHEDGDPSLSINLKTGLFHCHGCGVSGDIFKFYELRHGCDFKEALAALSKFTGVEKGKPWGKIVATYDYQNEKGRLLYQVVRLEPKSFRQRRPDGTGGWVWNLKGLSPVPYRLPGLLNASRVYLPEGEKDCDLLVSLGLTASCNPMGAGKARKSYGRYFQGLEVVILPDNDAPGRAHAQDWAKILHGQAASIKMLELPGLPEKGDVSDWLAAGGTVEKLETLAAAVPEWIPPPLSPPKPITGFSLSDLGNSRRMVAQQGQDLHHCHLSGKWFHWTGKFWCEDSTGEVMARAKQTVGSIYHEAGEGASADERKNLAHHALRSESNARIIGMVNLAKSEPGIPVDPTALDANPWLLNCENGTIDLLTGDLREHRRKDLLTRIAATNYDPDAPCGLWEKTVYKILSDNIDVYEFFQRALGYALTGSTREQVLFLLWGNGANGKSTVLNLVKKILGTYARQTPTETLLYKSTPTLNNDVARLDGPRFVTAFESDSGRRLAESLVKQLTGGDSVAARFLYGEYFDYIPQFKLFLSTNSKPVIRGSDNGIWRRLKMIPFAIKIPDEEQDQALPEKLWLEAPGILAWLVRGCLGWQSQGLAVPDEVKVATAEYRAEMDVLADFLAECCVVAPGATASAGDLYSAYCTWADGQAMKEREQLKQKSFGVCLSDRGFQRRRGGGGRIQWHGLGLKE